MWLKVLLFHSAIKYINFFSCNIFQNFFFSVFYMRQELADRQALHLMHVVKSHARAAHVACVAGGILVCFSIQCVFERHPRAWSIGGGWGGGGGGGRGFFVLGSAFARLTLRTAFNRSPDEPQIKNTSKNRKLRRLHERRR